MKDVNELREELISANDAYRAGNPTISDIEFDEKLEEFEQLVSADEYSEFRDSMNEGTIEHGTKIKHAFIMGSLDKIKNTDNANLKKFIKEHVKGKMNVSAKVDGISSVAHYVNGKLVTLASRGNGYDGVLFTDKAPYIKNLPQTISYDDELYVRGELVILNTEDIDSETNFRNVCAGYMNSKYWKKDDISKITFVPYTILGDEFTKVEQFKLLNKLGFSAAWNTNIDPNVDNLTDVLTAYAKKEHAYSCDGLVLIDMNAYNELDVYRPKNSKAFKINELTATTKIIDVDWGNVTKDGFLVPVFVLEPVNLGGAIISRASAANLDIIEKLGAKYGSKVAITKANDIIPHVDAVLDNTNATDISLPTECPCCGSTLKRDGVNLRCVNKNCKNQMIFRIMYFIKKLGVKNCSFATLENLNINTFDDLISFIPNNKYKMQTKLASELKDKVFTRSKQELLAALNFKDVGEILINKIVDFYGYDNVVAGNFTGLPKGIGTITLEKFKDSLQDNLIVVNNIINDSRYNYSKSTEDTSSVKTNNSNGMSVCFTGKLNTMSRTEASKKAIQAGYEVKGGVNKGLTYLVTNDPNSGSSKNKNAKKFGTKIITEEEFLKLVDNVEDIMNL